MKQEGVCKCSNLSTISHLNLAPANTQLSPVLDTGHRKLHLPPLCRFQNMAFYTFFAYSDSTNLHLVCDCDSSNIAVKKYSDKTFINLFFFMKKEVCVCVCVCVCVYFYLNIIILYTM